MRLKIWTSIALAFAVSTASADGEKNPFALDNEHDGFVQRLDATRLSALYTFTEEDSAISLKVEDEENNTYVFDSITVDESQISFLFNPEDEESLCKMRFIQDEGNFEGECFVFGDETITFTILLAEQADQTDETEPEEGSEEEADQKEK